MYLKSLQVVGFKSFADKTTVNFHPGVTAIVGPNGCGKSNVLDSIRWVLGEQSAKALRGGAMQDVIFSGTEHRKPLGMAEVSLTFGDCEKELGTEYNEITITRRVFRDGASEYEMNKTPCRLRDIHQMFMDTGIGRTAYSIMEQGKIDQILSSRPEDRRAIFEEAAGITKYKSQKKEALRKLENTEANLIRIADIIREVKRQIGSLQRQAGKARRYKELLEELKSLETKLARRQFDQLSAEITLLQTEVDSARASQEQLTLELDLKDQELHQLRGALEEIERILSEIRDEQNFHRNSRDRAEQRIQSNTARAEEFTTLTERCRLEISATEEKIKIQEEQLQTVNQQLERCVAELAEAETAHEAKSEEMQILNARIVSTEAERSEQEERISEEEREINQLRNQLSSLELQQRNFLFRVENLKTEQSSLTQRKQEAEERQAQHQRELDEAVQQLESARAQAETAREQLSTHEQQSREHEQSYRASLKNLESRQAQRDALAQLETTHAGAPAGAQQVFTLASRGDLNIEILGTLSEHIQVQPGYEAALALLLGESVNALIIKDQVAADLIIQQLKDGQERHFVLGPVQFARVTPASNTGETHASRFIKADLTGLPLIDSLLADAHVVPDLATAWQLKAQQPNAVVATLTGELITASGLIVIGKKEGASAAVLTRQNQLRALEQEIAPLAEETRRLQTEWETSQSRIEESRRSLQEAQGLVQTSEIAVATLRHSQKTIEDSVRELQRQHDAAALEIEHLSQQDQADRGKQEQLQSSLREKETILEEARTARESLSTQLADLADKENDLRQALSEYKIQLATRAQQRDSWQQQREPVAHRLMELRELVETRSREREDYQGRILQAQEEIVRAEQDKVQAEESALALESRLAEQQNARQEQQRLIEERDLALRGERKKLTDIQAVRSEQEVKLASQRLVLDNLRERIQRFYQMELEALPALDENETIDWTDIEAKAAEGRNRLDAMGPVNLESITEYEELEQRHTFLENQQNDLINAKQQLLEAITQINQTTQKLFAETFEKVRTNFQEMFTELFGGGKANLILSDENDPLECGIEIEAKPPGKQLQSITLLSGGEKTMTAVALLFAIYLVKPSPFCVLDEMDAPLDESNINRFIKILHRFVHQSQFVVITHNKRTISIADVLYGVTMEEHGVSKLVSVKLSKREDNGVKVPMEPVAVDPAVPSIAESFGKMTETKI